MKKGIEVRHDYGHEYRDPYHSCADCLTLRRAGCIHSDKNRTEKCTDNTRTQCPSNKLSQVGPALVSREGVIAGSCHHAERDPKQLTAVYRFLQHTHKKSPPARSGGNSGDYREGQQHRHQHVDGELAGIILQLC